MSNTKYTRDAIHTGSHGAISVPDEISCIFRFGKDDHQDQYIHSELIDIIEEEENPKKQAANITLSEAAYKHAAIMNIKNQLKLSSSLQVHSSDGSLISVFNTDANPSASSTYTNLEPSLDLSLGDPSFIQQILDNTDLTNSLPDLDLTDDLFDNFTADSESFDQILQFDPNMTIQDLTDVPMEQTQNYSSHELSSMQQYDSMNEETTTSSVSSLPSEDNECHNATRSAAKKAKNANSKLARFGNKQVIKYSDDYHTRRVKNNEAVKKSRMKAKEKQQSSESQMNKLTEENRMLNDRVDLLMKELQVLRSLYKELKPEATTGSNQALPRVNAP